MGKLADARQRIEHEMKRSDEFMNNINAFSDGPSRQSTPQVDAASEASSGPEVAEPKVTVDQVLAGDGMNDEMIGEFTCRVCMDIVGCGPMLTSCSHLFCGDCIKQWFTMNPGNKTWAQRAQDGGSVPCPVCKEPLNKETDLHPVSKDGDGSSRFLHNMLSGTRIMCANSSNCSKSGKCDWVGEYGSYQEHIRLCQNLPIYGGSSTEREIEPTDLTVSTHVESAIPGVEALRDVSEDLATIEPEAAMEQLDLTGLLGALVDHEAKQGMQSPTIEIEDTCSTHASEQLESAEPSDADLSDHLHSPAASDTGLSDGEAIDAHAPPGQFDLEQERRRRQARAQYEAAHQVAEFEKLAQQRVAMQYQAAMQFQQQQAQYQAAQYQAVQYQAAQYRAAQYQAAVAQYQAVQMAHLQQANHVKAAMQAHAMQAQAKKSRAKK